MLSADLIDIPIDPSSGDIVLTGGKIIMTSGVPAVVQGARIRMQMIAGEWFLDLDAGVPYFERVGVLATKALFGQKYDQSKNERAYRAALVATPGVLQPINSLNVSFIGTTRATTVTWSAKTAFGDTASDTLTTGA